jgi:ribosomal protein S18 acetylase RimI-like enzyme
MINVREATRDDLDAAVSMIEMRRLAYQRLEPIFWKKADNSASISKSYFERLLSRPEVMFLLAEVAGEITGFLIAQPVPTPPVYDAGPTAVIDDYCVADPSMWADAGMALLDEACKRLNERGIRQIVVVCGSGDTEKSAFLAMRKLSPASIWWTSTI